MEAAKTSAELAEETEKQRKLEEQQAEEARLKRIQDDKDRVLLLTFSNEAELEHARDNRIEVIDSVIRLIESSMESTQGKLDKLLHTAEQNYTSKGKDVPGGLAQKIEHFERKIDSRTAQLEAKTAERDKIREKYELDLERFRLLKSASN
jgi:predicted ATPase